jgi:hypothetical protein
MTVTITAAMEGAAAAVMAGAGRPGGSSTLTRDGIKYP